MTSLLNHPTVQVGIIDFLLVKWRLNKLPRACANITDLIRSCSSLEHLDKHTWLDAHMTSSINLLRTDRNMLMPGNRAKMRVPPSWCVFINVTIIYSHSVHFPIRVPYRFPNRCNNTCNDASLPICAQQTKTYITVPHHLTFIAEQNEAQE